MATLAIIPARGGSKRVPNKNTRPFLGVPLVSWTIRFARHLGLFDGIVVSTDSTEIAEIAEEEGVPVPWRRPTELASDTAGSVEMALHAIDQERLAGRTYETIALLQPTSPVRLPQRWHDAFDRLATDNFTAAIGLIPASCHPFHTYSAEMSGLVRPFVDGGASLRKLRTQELPPAYAIGGNLYLIKAAALKASNTFFPAHTAGVICDQPYEAFDIDTVADWIAAEAIAQHHEQEPWPPSS